MRPDAQVPDCRLLCLAPYQPQCLPGLLGLPAHCCCHWAAAHLQMQAASLLPHLPLLVLTPGAAGLMAVP